MFLRPAEKFRPFRNTFYFSRFNSTIDIVRK